MVPTFRCAQITREYRNTMGTQSMWIVTTQSTVQTIPILGTSHSWAATARTPRYATPRTQLTYIAP